jgi:excisionase family DNA binding protein
MSPFAPTKELERLHSIPEFADLTAYEKSTVHNLIREGKLRAVKLGQSTRIPHGAIVEFLDSHTRPIKPRPAHAA